MRLFLRLNDHAGAPHPLARACFAGRAASYEADRYAYSDSNIFRDETFSGAVKQGADGSIRGRAGFLATSWTLAYVTGGVAFASVSGSFGYTAHELASFGGACCSI